MPGSRRHAHVNEPPPHDPLSIATLTEYWMGELDERTQSDVEEHLFSCSLCHATLELLVAMGEGIRAVSRKAGVAAVLTPDFVRKLKAEGAQVREYSLQPGDSVLCTIAPDDDIVLAHLHAPLAGIDRLDAVFEDSHSGKQFRYDDIAFNPGQGEIVFAPKASDLRSYGKGTRTLRLLSVSAAGERVIGEYVFNHSPFQES
ncbi:MAG: zf-HC2 domain-containing protein [bacterium]